MRGIFAKEQIKKGETVLFVKDDIIISLDKAKNSPIGKELIEKKLGLGDNGLSYPQAVQLAVFNMQERKKGKDSIFYHHLKVQPGLDDFPIFFNNEELALLKGSPFLDKISEAKADI